MFRILNYEGTVNVNQSNRKSYTKNEDKMTKNF